MATTLEAMVEAAKKVVPALTAEQVQAIVRICHEENVPFVARGSGTGLSPLPERPLRGGEPPTNRQLA